MVRNNKMRQLIDIGTREVLNVEKLSPEFIINIGEQLNKPEMLHVETLYFTKDGGYYTSVHDYVGNDKRYKGKKFARFKYINTQADSNNGTKKWVRISVPIESYEVIKEYDASYFVNAFIKSLKK